MDRLRRAQLGVCRVGICLETGIEEVHPRLLRHANSSPTATAGRSVWPSPKSVYPEERSAPSLATPGAFRCPLLDCPPG